MTVRLAIILALCATSASALTLEFPANARAVTESIEQYSSRKLPISAFDDGDIQSIWAEGEVRQEAWHVPSSSITTLQILAPLREQLMDSGFDILFECEARDCGGFDFRYSLDVLSEPDMHVDLGDFRFLSAQRMGEERPEYVSLLVSRSSSRGFVQMTRIGAALPQASVISTSTKTPDATVPVLDTKIPTLTAMPADTELTVQLEEIGRAVLNDLTFQTGSSKLGDQTFASLETLATYLIANPNRSIVLVGHTDAEGSLGGNIALSKRRASSVQQHLITKLGVPIEQVKAEGVGFLSPMASNLTEAGRTINRRVEVILSSTK
jgi:outer membrane protein OmpA-like peptidoglycan-associated protein